MKINKAYKFRIYPNREQRETFEQYFGACRFVYNACLGYAIDSYKDVGKSFNAYAYGKDFTQIKKMEGYEWLKEIGCKAIEYTITNLDDAFKKFFREKKAGFPKFKSRKNPVQSFSTRCSIKVNFATKQVKIPKIDWIKYRDRRVFDEKIKSITISKNTCNQYFASILVEDEFKQNLENVIHEPKIFSADMSCKNFLVSSEMEFESQKFQRRNERKLKIRQRNLSRKDKGSQNREKEKIRVAKTYLKISNQRKGYQWNLSHELTQKFDAFCFEDLNIKGMQQFNSGISKTVTLDFSFSEFLTNLEWKCFKENKHFVKVDRFFPSSKMCSSCGNIKKDLALSDRIYKCECGHVEDRDINAAKNIKREGVRILEERGINLLKNSTGSTPGSNALGDTIEVTRSAGEVSGVEDYYGS